MDSVFLLFSLRADGVGQRTAFEPQESRYTTLTRTGRDVVHSAAVQQFSLTDKGQTPRREGETI